MKKRRLTRGTHPGLVVSPRLGECRFAADASMSRCRGVCCKSGVWADVKERDAVLANADVVRRAMRPEQERDETKWFDAEPTPDVDFPSGLAVGTKSNENGCVFLDGDGRCALQRATAELGAPPLKPFYCFAFPIVLEEGVLTVDEDNSHGQTACCATVPDGTKDVFDVCRWELEHVVGADGALEVAEILGRKP